MSKKETGNKIDFVITWVDGSDPTWQKEKAKYEVGNRNDARANRYRDWGLLKYWFRSVEKYAPWVNKIFFVTCGQIPEWLNTDNPKIQLVNHVDFIPSEYLPTFNSVTIELFLHKIPGLSEEFVYFNDDMFLNSKVKPSYFFKKGMPCDTAILSAIVPSDGSDGFSHCLLSNAELASEDYNIHSAIKKHVNKWFNIRYGIEQVRTLLLLPWHDITGIKMHHMPSAYKKSSFDTVWRKHKDQLGQVASDKFRNNYKVNHWVFRHEQLLSGNFMPRNPRGGKLFVLRDLETAKNAAKTINGTKRKMFCLNDNIVNASYLEDACDLITKAFNNKYPNKSSFEK